MTDLERAIHAIEHGLVVATRTASSTIAAFACCMVFDQENPGKLVKCAGSVDNQCDMKG